MDSVVNVSVFHRQGLKSTQDERTASAFLTVQLDDSMGGAPVQVCVIYISKPQDEHGLMCSHLVRCRVPTEHQGAVLNKPVNAPDFYQSAVEFWILIGQKVKKVKEDQKYSIWSLIIFLKQNIYGKRFD